MRDFEAILLLISWVLGVVIAKGFWGTSFSIVIPPYAWYLLAEELWNYWWVG